MAKVNVTKINRKKMELKLPVVENVPNAMYLQQYGGEAEYKGQKVTIGSTCGMGGVDLIISVGDRQFFLSGADIAQSLIDQLFK